MGEQSSRRIGPYRLEGELGRGGMGVVYRAYDERLDRRVAVKRLRPDAAAREGWRARFRREARTAARLGHPAIVQIHDVVEAEDDDWIVMELVEGPTVAELVEAGPLAVESAAEIARQIAEGLAAAHARGVVHRDLKAENVKVPEGGRVKILDFGLARPMEDGDGTADPSITISGQLLGTVRAMSPEQARGVDLDHRTDLFSLGVLLYEMLTGVSPFLGDTGVETLSRVLERRQPPVHGLRPEVPRELSDLVDRLLAKAPEHRPQDAARVARRLAAFASSDPEDGRIPLGPASLGPDTLPPSAAGSYALWPTGSRYGTAARWRRLLPWAGGAAAGLVLVITVFSAGPWTDFRAPEAAVAPRRSGVETPLTAHQQYRVGMESLERYERPGAIDEAIDAFQRALALDPESSAAYAGLALGYWRQYDFASRDPHWLEQAEAAAERAVELNDHLASARISRGLVSAALGRGDEAMTDFETALALDPTSADAHRGMARVHAARGELEAAEAAYRQALELRPDDRELHDLLGSLLFRTGRYREAERAFRRSIELAPESLIGYRNLSSSLFMQGRYPEAAEAIQQALEIEELPSLYTNLGAVFFNQGLYPRAVAAFEKSLDLAGGAHDYRIWANLADAYRWTPDNESKSREAYGRAIQLLAPLLERSPDDASLRSRLALYEAKRGRCEQAIAELASPVAVPGADASSRFRRAVASEVCGRREEALAELRVALAAGFSRIEVEADPELLGLRADRRYHELLIELDAAPPRPG